MAAEIIKLLKYLEEKTSNSDMPPDVRITHRQTYRFLMYLIGEKALSGEIAFSEEEIKKGGFDLSQWQKAGDIEYRGVFQAGSIEAASGQVKIVNTVVEITKRDFGILRFLHMNIDVDVNVREIADFFNATPIVIINSIYKLREKIEPDLQQKNLHRIIRSGHDYFRLVSKPTLMGRIRR